MCLPTRAHLFKRCYVFQCNIYNNDCLDILSLIADDSIDCIWLDPPYNTKNDKNKSIKYDRNADMARKNWIPFYADWDDITDYVAWSTQWLAECKRILKPNATVFICGTFHNIPDVSLALRSLNMYTIQWLQWCSNNAFPNLSMTKMINANQTIVWARKGNRHYYDKNAAKRYNNDKNLRDYWIINQDTRGLWKHPSKKPFDLVYRALDIATNKEQEKISILDFFAGSGVTGECAAQLAKNYGVNVECTLVEREYEHAQTCIQRVNYGAEELRDSRIIAHF